MLHEPIAARRSLRAFDPQARLSPQQVAALFDAARWAPSAMNRQPWRFIVGHRGDEAFGRIAEALSGNNRVWAPAASMLLVAMVDNGDPAAPTNPGRAYEVGLAMGQLGIQAQSMGLITHQMGGFDADAVRQAFDLPAQLRPMVVMAVGSPGSSADLPEPLRQREGVAPERTPLRDLLHPLNAE